MSESLGCIEKKGEVEGERPLISSELESDIKGSNLVAEEKGEDERVRLVSEDEILTEKQRENKRNTCTDAQTLKFAQELTKDCSRTQGKLKTLSYLLYQR